MYHKAMLHAYGYMIYVKNIIIKNIPFNDFNPFFVFIFNNTIKSNSRQFLYNTLVLISSEVLTQFSYEKLGGGGVRTP